MHAPVEIGLLRFVEIRRAQIRPYSLPRLRRYCGSNISFTFFIIAKSLPGSGHKFRCFTEARWSEFHDALSGMAVPIQLSRGAVRQLVRSIHNRRPIPLAPMPAPAKSPTPARLRKACRKPAPPRRFRAPAKLRREFANRLPQCLFLSALQHLRAGAIHASSDPAPPGFRLPESSDHNRLTI